jgi:hypothetical protein
VAKRWTGGG